MRNGTHTKIQPPAIAGVTDIKANTFAKDVLKGLTSIPKSLSSKYFYDDEGTRLFIEIMQLPEYYLTAAEMDIFTNQTEGIFNAFSDGIREFDLIELGAGDGTKTACLLYTSPSPRDRTRSRMPSSA